MIKTPPCAPEWNFVGFFYATWAIVLPGLRRASWWYNIGRTINPSISSSRLESPKRWLEDGANTDSYWRNGLGDAYGCVSLFELVDTGSTAFWSLLDYYVCELRPLIAELSDYIGTEIGC